MADLIAAPRPRRVPAPAADPSQRVSSQAAHRLLGWRPMRTIWPEGAAGEPDHRSPARAVTHDDAGPVAPSRGVPVGPLQLGDRHSLTGPTALPTRPQP